MIQQSLFTNWHFMRWLRLVLGIFIAIQAVQMQDTFSGFIAVFFLFQAVTNTGCCGTKNCALPSTTENNKTTEVEFEEITIK